MKLLITLKKNDAQGVGGQILQTLGMMPAKRDAQSFVKELAVTERLENYKQALESEDDDDGSVDASAGALAGRRRRRRRSLHPSDFLLYEDNSMYALPYIEPLTDRGIRPLRVSLITDSTAGLTPVNASASLSQDDEELARSALELAKSALLDGHADDQVIAALRAAAESLLEDEK